MISLIKKQLKRHFINNLQIPNFEKSLDRIKNLGYTPKVIFDVGAYKGDFTKLCLNLWNTSNVICFEPLKDKCEILEKWAEDDKRIKVIHGLLGEENQEQVRFNESETASSVLDEYISKDFQTKFHKMRTLDTCIKEFNLGLPNLVKIDTQGYEYQILNGFLNNIKTVEIIIAELNHLDIHKNVRLAEDVINLLYSNGFTIYDILEVHRRPYDNAIWQTDFMFVRKNSFLRENKQWK